MAAPGFDMDDSSLLQPSDDFRQAALPPSNGHSPPSHLLPDTPQSFANATDHLNGAISSMHVLAPNQPNLTPSSYLETQDNIDPSTSMGSTMPEFTSYIPTQSFESDIPVEAIAQSHATSLPSAEQPRLQPHLVNGMAYSVGSTSSLESALNPVTPARSRANTAGSYIAESPRVTSLKNLETFSPPESANHSHSTTGENPLVAGSVLLKEIAVTAESADRACRLSQVRKANSLLEVLKNKVSHVSELIANFTEVSLSDSPRVTPYGDDSKYDYFSQPVGDQSGFLSSPDERRKRCHSNTGEERPVKSLKAEPQENMPLFNTPPALVPSQIPHPCLPQSPPPSRPHTPPVGYPYNSITATYSNGYTGAVEQMVNSVAPPTLPPHRAAWSESIIPTRHNQTTPPTPMTAGEPSFPRVPSLPTLSFTNGGPIGRMSRSGSINGTFSTPFNSLEQSKAYPTPIVSNQDSWRPPASAPVVEPPIPKSKRTRSRSIVVPVRDDSDDDDDNDDDSHQSTPPSSGHRSISMDHPTSSSSSDVPGEYRSEVDRIFFEFLNRICSNLDATDAKGETIHQTLMAKKMQRLDESPDFRPFKFRIAAFTNAFLDELARQGFPEDKIPMKKVRNYLWRQPHILRFNEDGKKAKSKGNHIWNVEAKKAGEGKWEFRPFHRKLAGNPPGLAYHGLRWSWKPRIWDPQASWQNVPVTYSSPWLPNWLRWENSELSGIPSPDAQSCEITTNATFIVDGQEGHLTHTFTINIAPMSSIHNTTNFGRSTSSHDLQANLLASQRAAPPIVTIENSTPARVVSVLQNVAARVAEETTLVQRTTPPSQQQEQIGALVRQQRVLEHTIDAYDKAVYRGETTGETMSLASAVQDVVVQAAQTAIAPMSSLTGRMPSSAEAIQSAGINDMSMGVQGALAHAVKQLDGVHAASELDVMRTTKQVLRENAMRWQAVGGYNPVM